jgi:hypothetical protein
MTRIVVLRLTASLSACAAAVAAFDPQFGQLFRNLRAPHPWIRAAGVDGAAEQLARAVIWCGLAWLTVGLVASLLARVPGAVGDACSRLTIALLPSAIRRMLGLGLGLGVVVSPLAMPSLSAASAAVAPHQDRTIPTPFAPMHSVPVLHSSPSLPSTHATRPGDRTYVVQPGDSLWRIAREHDPGAPDSDITRTWTAWYETNRHSIGADPDHLEVGQRLFRPTSDNNREQK